MLTLYLIILAITMIGSFFLGFKRSFKPQKYLWLFLLLGLTAEILGYFSNLIDNSILNSLIFTVYLTISSFYFNWLYFSGNKKFIVFRNFLIVSFVAILLLNFMTGDFLKSIFLELFVSGFLICLSLNWFFGALQKTRRITDQPMFWISSALLILFSFYLLKTIPAALIFKNDSKFYSAIQQGFLTAAALFYVLIFVALLKFYTKQEAVTSASAIKQ